MPILFPPDRSAEIVLANQEFVNNLRVAIANNQIELFFNSMNFKPRYYEIVENLHYFPDGEEMIYNLYEHLIKNTINAQTSMLIERLSRFPKLHELLIRDFEFLYKKALAAPEVLSARAYNFATEMMKIPGGDLKVLSIIDEIILANPHLGGLLINEFSRKPYFEDLIKNNFTRFIRILKGSSIITIIKLLANFDISTAREFIKNNFELILNNAGSGFIYEIVLYIVGIPELCSLVKENLTLITKYSHVSEINRMLDELNDQLSLGLLDNADILKILKAKLSGKNEEHLTIGAIIKSGKSDYLKTILNHLLEQEGVEDFVSIGGDGNWSNLVFRIGSKVLKLGFIRNNPNCPQHYRILVPEMYEIIFDYEGEPVLYIEIQQFLSQEGITKEDIANFYKDLQNDGFTYLDSRGSNPINFGLLSELVASEICENNKVSESFKNKALVLIDRDFVWHKDDPNIRFTGIRY